MTSEDVLDEFRAAGALREGHFILASGRHSPMFLQKNLVFMEAARCERLCKALAEKIEVLARTGRLPLLDRIRSGQREERRLRLVSTTPEPEPSAVPERLADLPERERAILVLRYVDDLTMAQAADELGISVHAAESLAARAVRRVRRQEARDA
mgnify:CR=1 FL=1